MARSSESGTRTLQLSRFKDLTAHAGGRGHLIYSDPDEDGYRRGRVPRRDVGTESPNTARRDHIRLIVPGDRDPRHASGEGAPRVLAGEELCSQIRPCPCRGAMPSLARRMAGLSHRRNGRAGSDQYRFADTRQALKIDMDTNVLPNYVVEAGSAAAS